ncbi:MAG: hypothetical protein LBF22_00310 [Deltaproteobacteria bacterium]|jgi:hypothetical protein|nr:hypothetical protein [Deltaproteobacteria bacterium]
MLLSNWFLTFIPKNIISQKAENLLVNQFGNLFVNQSGNLFWNQSGNRLKQCLLDKWNVVKSFCGQADKPGIKNE